VEPRLRHRLRLIAGASGIAAPLMKDRAAVPDIFVGGFSSIIGFGLIAVSPLKVIFDREELESRIQQAGPGGDRCAVLATAEAMLVADAKNERFGRSWLIHSGNVLVGVGAVLVLGLGYDRWGSGIANGIASIARRRGHDPHPTVGLVRDLRHYRAGNLSQPTRRRKRIAWAGAPMVTPPGTGAGVYGYRSRAASDRDHSVYGSGACSHARSQHRRVRTSTNNPITHACFSKLPSARVAHC
jgi:hypothetical protein